jgi:hypothetical protein
MTIRKLQGTLIVIATAVTLIALALPASAATVTITFSGSDFFIPRPATATDQEGVFRPIATYDVVANGQSEFVGTTCRFVVTAGNGESVHPYNFGHLETNGSVTDINGTENQPNVARTVLDDPTLVLGETIALFNVMIPDDNGSVSTSVDYVVSATCTTDDTTTTTTVPDVTTTTGPPASTSTTTTPTGSTTTTAPTDTTTTSPGDTTTTTGGTARSTSTIPPVTPDSTLPFTGPIENMIGLSLAAAALILLGAATLLSTKD